jgi:hypothetical protein
MSATLDGARAAALCFGNAPAVDVGLRVSG